MVEGPGATRNGRKVRRLVGLVLQSIQPASQNGKGGSHNNVVDLVDAFQLGGRRLDSTFSIGKEVFLVLGTSAPRNGHGDDDDDDDKENTTHNNNNNKTKEFSDKPMALRLHFGMNGCLMVRKAGESSKLAPWRKNDGSAKKYEIRFGHAENHSLDSAAFGHEGKNSSDSAAFILEMVASTCTIVSAFVATSKLTRLQAKDVCGCDALFDPQMVRESILEKRSKAMICDALLDQERFPGVGNIIKIEGLHRAGVHPRRLVESLSEDELMATILECRNYAKQWLSYGKAPNKQVYNQTRCRTCRNGRVRMVKLGKDLSRVTFWCEHCQPWLAGKISIGKGSNDSLQITKNDPSPGNHDKPPVRLRPGRVCPQHGSKSVVLRRVRKTGSDNIHRLFRICRVQGCPYFSWADSHLPSCGQCSRKTVLRVSKTERSGGRWFLSCAKGAAAKKKMNTQGGCSFFQWATPDQLAPLDEDLSPLT